MYRDIVKDKSGEERMATERVRATSVTMLTMPSAYFLKSPEPALFIQTLKEGFGKMDLGRHVMRMQTQKLNVVGTVIHVDLPILGSTPFCMLNSIK